MSQTLTETVLEFPLRWVYGAVRRSGEISYYEVPAFGWVLDVHRYLQETLGDERAGQILQMGADQLQQYPTIYWVEERMRLHLMRADTNWDRWAHYIAELSVPGESWMEAPMLLVDVDRQVFFIIPDREILPMRLEIGIPDGWGWRAVNRSEFQEIMNNPDYAESILHGASNQVVQAALRRSQRVVAASDERAQVQHDRVKAIIRRRLAGSRKGGTS